MIWNASAKYNTNYSKKFYSDAPSCVFLQALYTCIYIFIILINRKYLVSFYIAVIISV